MPKRGLVWIRCENPEVEEKVKEEIMKARELHNLFSEFVFLISYGEEIEIGDPQDFIEKFKAVMEK